MADYDYLDKKNDDGTVLGQTSSSKIGFFGITPADQPAALTTALTQITVVSATTYTTALSCSATSFFGWDTLAEGETFLMVVKNCQIRLAEIAAALAEVGIVAGGTATALTDTKYDVVGAGGGSDGMILGKASTDLVGFWGTTPVDQPAALTAGLITIALTSTVSTTTYVYTFTTGVLVTSSCGCGFASDDAGSTLCQVVQNAQARIIEVEARLAEAGIIAGGTALVTSTAQFDFLDKGNDDGTMLGRDATALVGFWGTTPAAQQSALTAALTTITCTISTTTAPDYALAEVTITGFVFVDSTSGDSLLAVVQNIQTRLGEIETALETVGLVAAN